MQRFSPQICHGMKGYFASMSLDSNGYQVLYSDHLAEIAVKNREIARLEGFRNPITCSNGHRFYAAVTHPAKSEGEWECPNCLSEELHALKRLAKVKP